MTGFPASGSAGSALDPNQLASGEATIDRLTAVTTVAAVGNQTLQVAGFTAGRTETCNNIFAVTAGTAAAATPTLCRMGVWSVDGSGNLTLVASCVNDTTLFAAANTKYIRALQAPFSKVAGQRYMMGLLVVTAVALPTFVGSSTILSGVGPDMILPPVLMANIAGQPDLPASVPAGSLVQNGTRGALYMGVTP